MNWASSSYILTSETTKPSRDRISMVSTSPYITDGFQFIMIWFSNCKISRTYASSSFQPRDDILWVLWRHLVEIYFCSCHLYCGWFKFLSTDVRWYMDWLFAKLSTSCFLYSPRFREVSKVLHASWFLNGEQWLKKFSKLSDHKR